MYSFETVEIIDHRCPTFHGELVGHTIIIQLTESFFIPEVGQVIHFLPDVFGFIRVIIDLPGIPGGEIKFSVGIFHHFEIRGYLILPLVIPDLKDKFYGMAIRVPTPTVSLVDFVTELKKDTTADEVNAAFKAAAEGPMQGILGYTEEPLVSMDYKGDPRSSIVDGPNTVVMGGKLLKVLTWYDNEWAYSVRLADLAKLMVDKGL